MKLYDHSNWKLLSVMNIDVVNTYNTKYSEGYNQIYILLKKVI